MLIMRSAERDALWGWKKKIELFESTECGSNEPPRFGDVQFDAQDTFEISATIPAIAFLPDEGNLARKMVRFPLFSIIDEHFVVRQLRYFQLLFASDTNLG